MRYALFPYPWVDPTFAWGPETDDFAGRARCAIRITDNTRCAELSGHGVSPEALLTMDRTRHSVSLIAKDAWTRKACTRLHLAHGCMKFLPSNTPQDFPPMTGAVPAVGEGVWKDAPVI